MKAAVGAMLLTPSEVLVLACWLALSVTVRSIVYVPGVVGVNEGFLPLSVMVELSGLVIVQAYVSAVPSSASLAFEERETAWPALGVAGEAVIWVSVGGKSETETVCVAGALVSPPSSVTTSWTR